MQNKQKRKTPNFVSALLGRLSLRFKLTLLFAGVTIAAVSTLAYYNYQSTRADLTQSVSQNLINTAQVQGAAIGDLLTRQINLLQSLGASQTIQDMVTTCNNNHCGDPAQVDLQTLVTEWSNADANHNDSDPLVQAVINNPAATEISAFRESFPDNIEVLVANQYGLVLAASNRTSTYSNLNETWWQTAYNNGRGEIYIGQPILDANLNNYGIVIAVPIYATGTHNAIGVLRSIVRLTSMRDLLASANFGQTGESDLMFRGGQTLAPNGVLSQWPAATVARLGTTSPKEVIQMALNDKQHLVSQSLVTSSDPTTGPFILSLKWRVVTSIEPTEALAPVNAAALVNVLISLLVLIISVILALIATQYLTRPIIHLTAMAEQVLAGNLNARADIESQDEIGVLAQTFNHTASQLRDHIGNLEQRVKERTADIERQTLRMRTAAEIARDSASASNLDELLERSSRLIRDRFDFYHTGIFLLDDKKEFAVLWASPTDAGRAMIENNHRLRIGEQGIVGRAAATGEPRIALDTGTDPVHFDNPYLPLTRSEMALPLKTGEGVLGVLDVQSEQTDAFNQEDIAVMQVMADQLATAIERTRLIQQIENDLKRLEKVYSGFTERSWNTFSEDKRQTIGYRYDNIRLEPIHDVPQDAKEALKNGVTMKPKNQSDNKAIIPISLRGQTIGVVNIRFQGDYAPQETINLVEQITNRLASALENARLVEETRQRSQRDALVAELTGRLRSTLDLETVLRTAAGELQKAFNLQEAEVQLGISATTEPETPKKNGGRRN
jgi:GAF domain-containing protein/HAMP domain-containing protein